MNTFRKCFFVFSLIASLMIASSVHAEKTYDAGILSDYAFSGNNVTEYGENSIKDIFTDAENSALNMKGDFTLSDGLDALSGGSIDILCMVPISGTLTPYVDYASEPMATGFLTLLAPSDSKLYFEDFTSFNNIKVGI